MMAVSGQASGPGSGSRAAVFFAGIFVSCVCVIVYYECTICVCAIEWGGVECSKGQTPFAVSQSVGQGSGQQVEEQFAGFIYTAAAVSNRIIQM